jgi:hypothetical protein
MSAVSDERLEELGEPNQDQDPAHDGICRWRLTRRPNRRPSLMARNDGFALGDAEQPDAQRRDPNHEMDGQHALIVPHKPAPRAGPILRRVSERNSGDGMWPKQARLRA